MILNKQIAPRVGKIIRVILRQSGVALYHLGLSKWVVEQSPHRVRTLLYHSVEQTPGSYTAGLNVNVTPQTFAMQMDYFRSHYSACTIEQVLDGISGPCPGIITFDDGYASVEENAVPILEQRRLPATVYLIGSAVNGGDVWVNRLNHALNCNSDAVRSVIKHYPTLAGLEHAAIIHRVQTTFSPADVETLLQRLSTVTGDGNNEPADTTKLFSSPDDIIAMQKRGIFFGFHTQDHYNLKLCDEEMLKRQLDNSNVAALLNSNTFAYPFGYYSQEAIQKLQQQGYDQLMTVGSGTQMCSALHQGRSEIFGTTKAAVFAQLEVEEPVMEMLRQTARHLLSFFKGSGLEAVGLAGTTASSRGQTSLPMKNDIPETSKPR